VYYPEDVVEEVRVRNDILEVISLYVKLVKKGSSYFGLCPFHNEKTASFSVSTQKQMYYCFGCGAGGNVISFVMQYENYSFTEALTMLAERAGISLPNVEPTKQERQAQDLKLTLLDINKMAANYYYSQLNKPNGAMALEYLMDRKLSEETIKHFGLGFSNKTPDDLYRFFKSKNYDDTLLKDTGLITIEERGSRDKFWNRVMFPILDINNRVIGFGGRVMGEGMPKYLNSPETKLFDKSRNLYGLNFARTSRKDYMLLCEGYMDVISLHQAGFTNAVASLGTAFTQQQAMLLKRYVSKIIITYDSDEAGIKAALRAIPIFKEFGISTRIINMKPYKDPDEFIKNLGNDEYQKRIDEAKNSFLWEIDIYKRDYNLQDPEQKTAFQHYIAKRLCMFTEKLERDNYMHSVADQQFIQYEDLKRMVNVMGEQIVRIRKPDSVNERKIYKPKSSDDGILKSQRLLITWMIEDESLFDKIKEYINPDDFTEQLYHDVAIKIYKEHENGTLNPASILNEYVGDEDKSRKVAELFNTDLGREMGTLEKNKAISESIIKIKQASLDKASQNAISIEQLQKIIKEQAEFKTKKIIIN